MRRIETGIGVLTASLWLTAIWPLSALGQSAPWDPTQPAPVNQPPSAPPTMAMAPMAPQVPSAVAVGRTKGLFSVSAAGAANYTIPLWTPPGIAGMQPNLALTYSSGAGDDLYGVGWALSGLSNINRCQKTVGQDNVSANVFLVNVDLFCLDGNKLRSFAGTTYGADGAQYQTEFADFSLVISHGTAGTGPAWFEVHGKNGLIYEYGHTAHSTLLATGTTSVITWALDKITDRFGNHIDFDYINDTTNQVLRPNTITYTTPPTGFSGQTSPNYQVLFSYVSRSGQVPGGFIAGAQFMEPYLAQTITISDWNGSAYAAVRTYNFTYTTGPTTGRSQLTSIQECSPTQCFPATTVGYQNGTAGWSAQVATAAKSNSLYNAIVCDLNGDGIDDLVYTDATTGHTYYMLGSTSGTFQGPWDLGSLGAVLPIDYNGDGKTDLLVVNSSGNWRIMFFVSAGSAFSTTDTTTPAPPAGNVMTGDVDGDGRDDIIWTVFGDGGWDSADYIYYRLNTGSGFGAQQLLDQIGTNGCAGQFSYCEKLVRPPAIPYNSHIRRPDVNGDGRVDFFAQINPDPTNFSC